MEEFKEIENIDFVVSDLGDGRDTSSAIKDLQKYISKLKDVFKKEQNNFSELCYWTFKVKDLFLNHDNLYYDRFVVRKNGCFVRFIDIMEGFGIDETQSSRILSCYDKFICINNDKPYIKEDFKLFNKSKLFELINVPNEQLLEDIKNKVLRPDMSVKAIREYVKNYKELQKANKRLENGEECSVHEDEPKDREEDIPMVYDPKKHYEFNYFESKTKSQLLNMIWDLQKEYEKLSKKLKKEKK